MKERITQLVSSFVSGIPVPALAATPLGEILFYNKAWEKILTPLLANSGEFFELPTTLNAYLKGFGVSSEVIETWILRSLEQDSGEEADPSIVLLPLPNNPYLLSFKPIRHDGIVLLLVTAIPQDNSLRGNYAESGVDADRSRKHDEIVRQLKSEIERLRGSIEALSTDSNHFLRELGHEYRTPLSSILGLLELSLLHNLPEQTRQHLLQAQNAARELLTLVNDGIDFSDIDANSVALHNRRSSPEKLIKRILTLTSRTASQQKLEVAAKVSPSAPSLVIIDERRLGQVLLNTLIFILEHATPRGGIVIYADHETEQFPAEDRANILRVCFGYWDAEITNDEVRRLFAHSETVGTDYASSSGLSRLRLSLVGKILDRLGGGVNIRHIPRRGVRIELSIPVGDARETANGVTVAHPPTNPVRKKVLIAEDNPVNARVMALMLEYLDAQFVLVKNGAEALRAFEKDEAGFDLILMDCQMPEIDGFEATRAIRQMEKTRSYRTPIVAMTAYALPGGQEACFDAGMDGHLLKPISARQLGEVLTKFGLSTCLS